MLLGLEARKSLQKILGMFINRKLKRVQRNQQRFEKSECRCSNKAILTAFSGITVVLGASIAIAVDKIADLVVPLYGVGIK